MMMRLTILLIAILLIGNPLSARIKTIPFPQLVKTSEAIVIAKVVDKKYEAGKRNQPVTSNHIIIERVLKGELKTNDSIQIITSGNKAYVPEGRPSFPEIGSRTLLFIRQREDGKWVLFNGIQGLWPLEPGTEKTLAMGYNYSIKDVEAELSKKQK